MPLTFTNVESELIEGFNTSAKKLSSYWSSEEISSIKLKIKRHFLRLQSRKCCYCRQRVRSLHGRIWDIEHVEPRSVRPDFMFVEDNLAVSCIDCNVSKSSASVIDGRPKGYPKLSGRFKIVHPKFDRYGDHIGWNGSSIYIPLSDKGKETVIRCNLLRYAVEQGQLALSAGDTRFERQVDIVFSEEPSQQDRLAAVNEILDALARPPEAEAAA